MSTSTQRFKDFVCAYCWPFGDIPFEIIHICIAYCYIGEEFRVTQNSLSIEGSNHTICKYSKPFSIHGFHTCFGCNIISNARHTYYRWRLITRTPDEVIDNKSGFAIGIAEINSQEMTQKFEKIAHDYDDGRIFDFYVDFENNEVSVYAADRKYWDSDGSIDASKEYRLAITSDCVSFEILAFHVANPGDSDIDLALAMHDKKMQHFESAIRTNPNSFTHCDEYIALLLFEEEYVKAYDFILRFIERRWIPMEDISEIAEHFYNVDMNEKSKKMFDLVDDESLKEFDLMEIKASNYHRLKDYKNALKYFEFCLANTQSKSLISYCLGSMALLYDFKNTEKTEKENLENSIRLTRKALEYRADEPNEHSNLGYFLFVKGDYSESYKHLKRSIEIQPNGTLVNGNMANLLYAMKRYDESIPFFEKSLQIDDDLKHPEVGPKCLENYANVLYLRQKYAKSNDLLYQLIQRNDFSQHLSKDAVYWLLSLNFEKMGNLKKAMQYMKKAQRIQPRELYANKLKKLKYKKKV